MIKSGAIFADGKRDQIINATNDLYFLHYYGILRVPGSKEVSRIDLLNERATLSREPGGARQKVALEKGFLVLVFRELEDWAFLGLRINVPSNNSIPTNLVITGWVKSSFLDPAPKRIYVSNFEKIPEQQLKETILGHRLPRFLKSEEDRKIQMAIKAKVEAIQEELKKDNPVCPEDFTDLEKDGLVLIEEDDPLGNVRHQLFLKCNKTEYPQLGKKVTQVRLTKDKCDCVSYNPLDIDKVELKRESADFRKSKSEPIQDCRLGRKFVLCRFDTCGDSEGDCSMPPLSTLACPLSCVRWKEK